MELFHNCPTTDNYDVNWRHKVNGLVLKSSIMLKNPYPGGAAERAARRPESGSKNVPRRLGAVLRTLHRNQS
jgi:hypothetical protein